MAHSFNPRRLQQAATLPYTTSAPTAGISFQSTPPSTGGDTPRWRRRPASAPSFQSTPPSTGGDTPAQGIRSMGLVHSFQSTPPSTGGDTQSSGFTSLPCMQFQSTPPSTGGDTRYPGYSVMDVGVRFNPRRLQQAATPGPGFHDWLRELKVSIHAAFNRRRHPQRVRHLDVQPSVSIHAAFNRRRHAM